MRALAHAVHLLTPHESNNHRARILHPAVISLFAIFVLAIQFALPSVSKLGPAVLGYSNNIPVEKVVELTNKEREKAGLPALEFNSTLSRGAKEKALDMFAKDYWAHNAPDGTQPWKFFSDAGYEYRYAGENLARDFSTAEDAVKAWMESPTHRDNLLSRRYKDIGIAVVDGELKGVETTLIVQHFGTQFGDAAPIVPTPAVTSPELQGASTVELVAGIKNSSRDFLISPLGIVKKISGVILGVLVGVLLLDMFIVKRANIFRFSSKSSAHFLFLGMVLIVVVAQKAGWIL